MVIGLKSSSFTKIATFLNQHHLKAFALFGNCREELTFFLTISTA